MWSIGRFEIEFIISSYKFDIQKSFLNANEEGEEMHIEINIDTDDLTLNSNTKEDYNLTVAGKTVT